jgi:DNA-binding beta-propeller fold protein YncE
MSAIRNRRRPRLGACLAALAAAATLSLPAAASAQFSTGDILIADPAADPNGLGGNTGAVFRVDPVSGAVVTIATGPPLLDPTDVAVDHDGNLVIADEGGDGAVYRLAPGGAPALVATADVWADPDGIAVDADGEILLADNNADPNNLAVDTGAVFRVVPGGAPVLLAQSPEFQDPGDLAIGAGGEIYVADDDAFPSSLGAVFRFTPPGVPTAFVSGAPLSSPDGVAVDARGAVLVADDDADPATLGSDTGAIFKVAPSGALTTLSTSAAYDDPEHIAIEATGQILVVDDAADPTASGNFGAVFRVDPASGAVASFASSDLFTEPEGVAVVPPRCGGRLATIVGDATANKLRGTAGADVIWGGGGKDEIKGGKGADRICGDVGNDRLFGQKGKDRLIGGNGKDRLNGGKGKDNLKGGKGSDTLRGGPGKDKLRGGKGRDSETQ